MAQLLQNEKADIGSSLEEPFAAIAEYQRLGANWDGENALAVEQPTASRTRSLLNLIAEQARQLGLRWENPSVAPSPEGGLELTWERGARWAMLIVHPNDVRVGCAAQEAGVEPQYQLEAQSVAVDKALWALQGEE